MDDECAHEDGDEDADEDDYDDDVPSPSSNVPFAPFA